MDDTQRKLQRIADEARHAAAVLHPWMTMDEVNAEVRRAIGTARQALYDTAQTAEDYRGKIEPSWHVGTGDYGEWIALYHHQKQIIKISLPQQGQNPIRLALGATADFMNDCEEVFGELPEWMENSARLKYQQNLEYFSQPTRTAV